MPSHLFPPDQSAQTYRLKRTLLAAAFYTLCALVIGFGTWQGLFPPLPLALYSAGFVIVSAVFFLIIRRGWNLRFADPSLTEAQILCSIGLCSYIIIYAGPLRGVFMFAYVIALMFGGTQLTMRQTVRLALLPVLLFPLAVVIASGLQPEAVDWRIELAQWIALAVIMAFTAMLVGNVARLRTRLKASNAELKAAMDRLTEMAVRDDLTGLYNRRHMLDMLEREKSRINRSEDGGFCVCMLDIDHFKRINDSYGHGDGDTVLRMFAWTAEQCIRSADVLARWGGEEFLLLLPQTPPELAESCVERIRAALARTVFDGLPRDLRITVSAGIAQYRSGGTVKELIERADAALYQAKRSGRNRSVLAEPARLTVI